MRFLRPSFALSVLVLGFTLTISNANASSFLHKLDGDWRGSGTLKTHGETPKKEALACRISAKYNQDKNNLAISGRCGAAAGTTSFQSTLIETSNGTVTGKPILQRGDLAKITLTGKTKSTSLKLVGADDKNQIHVTFILQGDSKFQSQSGRSQAGKAINTLVINWKKQ
ncbi:hypothetical protein [Cohaesibacter celericrescens]|uniref:hypothetical protein n=1 Tax=Cohaesibacter celericrescens TaxID=2067669 RepID=UPI00356A8716